MQGEKNAPLTLTVKLSTYYKAGIVMEPAQRTRWIPARHSRCRSRRGRLLRADAGTGDACRRPAGPWRRDAGRPGRRQVGDAAHRRAARCPGQGRRRGRTRGARAATRSGWARPRRRRRRKARWPGARRRSRSQPVVLAPGPPRPPPPPPIPYRFIGVLTGVPGQGRIAVLTDGRSVVHGRVNDIIEGRYRIVQVIGEESLQIEHYDGRGRQTIRSAGTINRMARRPVGARRRRNVSQERCR